MSKCPDCDGEVHPSYRAHWFKPMANSMANAVANSEPSMANTVVDRMANKVSKASRNAESRASSAVSGDAASRTYQYRDAEARKAYQREYMKKKRAKACVV